MFIGHRRPHQPELRYCFRDLTVFGFYEIYVDETMNFGIDVKRER